MDGITLILEAEAAGLSVQVDGDRLVIRGPRSADAIARRLLAEKPAVVAALRSQTSPPGAIPTVCRPTAMVDAPEPAPDPFAGWVLRPDAAGRMGWEAPDLSEVDRWWVECAWEDLPTFPEPCPVCGSLELWWDLLGGVHCQRCERPVLERSLRLAEKAAGIRQRTRLAEAAAHGKPRPCVPAGSVDV
jgi:hypothetical protein